MAVVGCAADGLEQLRTGLVEPAVRRGWQVAVTLTPNAGRWLHDLGEADALRRLTGLPVRDTPRLPPEPRPHPYADCFVVAPASANTIAKLATGHGDNQALTQLCEALGTPGVPVVLHPRVNTAHTRHPAWPQHLAALGHAGVHLVHDPVRWPLPEPRRASADTPLPWAPVLAIAEHSVDVSRADRPPGPGL